MVCSTVTRFQSGLRKPGRDRWKDAHVAPRASRRPPRRQPPRSETSPAHAPRYSRDADRPGHRAAQQEMWSRAHHPASRLNLLTRGPGSVLVKAGSAHSADFPDPPPADGNRSAGYPPDNSGQATELVIPPRTHSVTEFVQPHRLTGAVNHHTESGALRTPVIQPPPVRRFGFGPRPVRSELSDQMTADGVAVHRTGGSHLSEVAPAARAESRLDLDLVDLVIPSRLSEIVVGAGRTVEGTLVLAPPVVDRLHPPLDPVQKDAGGLTASMAGVLRYHSHRDR